jgi:hypothetical protein
MKCMVVSLGTLRSVEHSWEDPFGGPLIRQPLVLIRVEMVCYLVCS